MNFTSLDISSATEPLLKTIEIQDKLIKKLENEVVELKAKVKKWEDWKASSKKRLTKGREQTKNHTKQNKLKVGFMKKHKKSKS